MNFGISEGRLFKLEAEQQKRSLQRGAGVYITTIE